MIVLDTEIGASGEMTSAFFAPVNPAKTQTIATGFSFFNKRIQNKPAKIMDESPEYLSLSDNMIQQAPF